MNLIRNFTAVLLSLTLCLLCTLASIPSALANGTGVVTVQPTQHQSETSVNQVEESVVLHKRKLNCRTVDGQKRCWD
jgi:hypothetical protein